ncbi:MAG: DUF924 domain-containing protein [Myxococcales bacterium]|nr:DUF924 domain-containing protein [Myxococcales bacterium]
MPCVGAESHGINGTVDDAERERVEAILEYWFGALEGPHDVDPSKNALWWAGGAAIDAEIRERFGELVTRARAGELDHWAESPRPALALVILLDQFTRNLGRGTAEAFAGDAAALRVTLRALERGFDQQLRPVERGFLCMPLMHAEDREMARRSLEVFARLAKEVAELGLEGHPDFHPSAVTHAEIVERFGRYPHRNPLLGREPTPEETAFLADGGPSFGQSKQ